MKFLSIAAVANIAAVVSAQSLADLPSCALACLSSGLPSTSCSITNLACACSNSKFISDSAACIQKGCPAADQQKALVAAAALCKANGVDIPTTFPGSEPTTTAAGTTTSVATTSSTTSAAGTTSVIAPYAPGSNLTTKPVTTGGPTIIPTIIPSTTAIAGNATNTTRPSLPTSISNGAERLTTALSLVGLSIAAAYFAL